MPLRALMSSQARLPPGPVFTRGASSSVSKVSCSDPGKPAPRTGAGSDPMHSQEASPARRALRSGGWEWNSCRSLPHLGQELQVRDVCAGTDLPARLPTEQGSPAGPEAAPGPPAEWEPVEGPLVTFALLVGELMVGQAEPPLLEVLHPKAFSSLRPLDHEPVTKARGGRRVLGPLVMPAGPGQRGAQCCTPLLPSDRLGAEGARLCQSTPGLPQAPSTCPHPPSTGRLLTAWPSAGDDHRPLCRKCSRLTGPCRRAAEPGLGWEDTQLGLGGDTLLAGRLPCGEACGLRVQATQFGLLLSDLGPPPPNTAPDGPWSLMGGRDS